MNREELVRLIREGLLTIDDIDIDDLDLYEQVFDYLDEEDYTEEQEVEYRTSYLGLVALIVTFMARTPTAPTDELKANVFNNFNDFFNTITSNFVGELNRFYQESYRQSGGTGIPPNVDLINARWAEDSRSLNNRLLRLRNATLSELDSVIDSLSDGDLQGALNQLEDTFRTSNNILKATLRTELNYSINQGFLESMKSNGIEEYEYSAILDSRTSEICESLDGLVFKVADAEVGENYPPMHPLQVYSNT